MQRLSRLVGLGYILICLAALVSTALGARVGYAPLPLRIGPAAQPIVVTVWYGTEKEAWLKEAVTRFAATAPSYDGRPIQIELKGLGSREIAERVAQQQWGNDAPPTVVSPASSLWLELLKDEWPRRGNSGPVLDDAPQPLVLTPLVIVVWEKRAQALWNNASTAFWPEIHDALADPQGWKGHVHPSAPETVKQEAENWGFVKFGHTSPLTSNSGAQTLILMAYGYHNKTSKLNTADILDAGFQQWFLEVENSVLEFGESTGTFMENMVRFGPSKYDLAAVYENLAIQHITNAQGRWGDTLRVVYPPATLFSDHPYAIVQGAWTTPEQRGAAEQFRQFLLTRPLQELALQYGFRPADPGVSIMTSDPNNPFTKYAPYGVQVDISQQVEVPPGEVIATLLDLWRRQINR
jgi:hypothetical protein